MLKNKFIKMFFLLILVLVFILLFCYNFKTHEMVENDEKSQNMYRIYNSTEKNISTTNINNSIYNNTKIYNQIITSNQNENLENNVSSENIIVKSVSGNFDSNIEKNPELVNLKITKYDLENNRVTLTITDNNEVPYWWDSTFEIEIKKDNAWHEAERINPKTLLLLKKDYIRDENNQIDFIIHWINDYGILQPGIYRIVKESEKDMLFYSNEFEIK